MKKRKFLVLLLAALMLVTFTACSSNDDGKTDDNGAEPEVNVVEEAVTNYFAEMPDDIYKIDQTAFIEKVKAGEEMTIIDIRSAEMYAAGHIKGAVNLAWGGTAISDNLSMIPTDKPVYIYCVTGQTAGQTVALMNMAGIETKSVNLGWNFGISKVAGYEAYVETTENKLDAATKTEIDADVMTAISEYYAGMAEVANTRFANYKITEVDAKAALDSKDETVMFLDVRSAEDYAKGHIEGAINLPFGKGMQEKFSTLPTDKTIIVYCYTGQTAGQVTGGLRMLGYDAVSMNGGMGTPANVPMGWANNGFPVVTE